MRWEHIEYGVPVAAFSDNDHRHVAVWNSAPEANKSNQRIRFVLSDLVLAEINSFQGLMNGSFLMTTGPRGAMPCLCTRPEKGPQRLCLNWGFLTLPHCMRCATPWLL